MTNNTGPIQRAIARALQSRAAKQVDISPSLHPKPQQHTEGDEVIDISTTDPPSKRRKIHVTTLSNRHLVTKWMVDTVQNEGSKHIGSKTVRRFPGFFPGNEKANLAKASLWLKNRNQTMGLKKEVHRVGTFAGTTSCGIRRANFKSLAGRGRKRSKWCQTLCEEHLSEFDRLRKISIKFSATVLRLNARALIENAPTGIPFHSSVKDNNRPVSQKVTIRWVQHFMNFNKIFFTFPTGKLLASPKKTRYIERTVAFHLGVLKRGFECEYLNESDIENADETHFIFNMDNGKTLGFQGDNEVKYADVVSGSEHISMMVRLTGGVKARIETPMLIFKNKNRSYPMQRVPDDVPVVCYRSGPKSWMDGTVFKEYLSEPRAIKSLTNNRQLTIYVDNCAGHVIDDDTKSLLSRIRTNIEKIPPNATNLVQPCDSFIIQNIEDAWRTRWDHCKYECVRSRQWSERSGKLPNPGKRFYLRLAAETVRDVNAQRARDGLSMRVRL